MAYGNYQNGYQMPIYGQQVYPQMQAQQPQQPQNGIQWVQGEAGAKSYLDILFEYLGKHCFHKVDKV